MANIRLKDKAEIGRNLSDDDLIFVTKTSEDTDNPSTFGRIKNQIITQATGLTETFYSKTGHTHSSTQITDLNTNYANLSGATFVGNVFVPEISASTLYSGSTELGTLFAKPSDIINYTPQLNTKANLSGTTFTGNIFAPIISGNTLYSGSTELGTLFAKPSDIVNYTPQLNTKANLSGATFTGNILASSLSATTFSASSINGDVIFDQVYLTFSGNSGTTSGTKGCILISAGTWFITQFSTVYYIDDTDGNITVIIPDSDATNLGKTIHVSKPRLVQSGNNVLIKTVSNQAVAETSTFYLRSPNDRAELISVPFISNGATGYKYRVNMIDRSIHEAIEISIGGTQLFSTIKSAIDYVNNYADGPRRLKINPGTYYIGETVSINCPYNIAIQGFSPELTHFVAQPSLSGTPMFEIITKCDFDRITFSGCSGYGLVDDECCLDCSSDDLYIELHNVIIDGFYKGFEIDGNTEGWLFDSIVENCQYGIWISGGTVGISETTLENNEIGAYFANTSTATTYSIQNTIFNINTNQVGILYVDNNIKPLYNFASGNAFYGDGTYISGLTFSSITQADIRYESNVGLQDYKPECWVWVSGNTNATTLTTAGTYYKANIDTNSIQVVDMIKFSGGADTQYFTYLPKITRKGVFTISGDISASNNNDILSVALYKNETIKLQDIDIRTTTSTQPYPFAFNGINNINPNDKFDIRISNLGASSRSAILKTLMFAITT